MIHYSVRHFFCRCRRYRVWFDLRRVSLSILPKWQSIPRVNLRSQQIGLPFGAFDCCYCFRFPKENCSTILSSLRWPDENHILRNSIVDRRIQHMINWTPAKWNENAHPKKRTHTTKINWFIFYWSQRVWFSPLHMHENSTSQNETANRQRARPAKFVQIVLCAVYAHSTLRTHGDHDECSPSRSSETANLLFIPHSSPLYFLHLSIFLAHAACIRRPRYETLKLNYCCQTPKYNICPTDGYSTIGCDRIPNNINLRYGLHCERSRFHCMKRRVSSPEGNDITECQRSLFASNNRQWEKFARK